MFTFEFERGVRELARERDISFEKALLMELSKTLTWFAKPSTLLKLLKDYGGLTEDAAQALYEHVKTRASDGTVYGILKTFCLSRLPSTKWPVSLKEEKTQQFLFGEPKKIVLSREINQQVFPGNWMFLVLPKDEAESFVLAGMNMTSRDKRQLDMYRTGRGVYLCNDLNYCIQVAKDYYHDRKDLAIVGYTPICLDGFEGEDWRVLTRKQLFAKVGQLSSDSKPDYIIGPGITYRLQYKRKSPTGVEMLYIHSHALASVAEKCVSTTLSLIF